MTTVLLSSSMTAAVQPATQHLPKPRATTAACEVMPPRAVRMPSELIMPAKSSGDVSRRTRMTGRPSFWAASASAVEKQICPEAAPGEAPSPVAKRAALSKAFVSKVGWSNLSSWPVSMRITASSFVIRPSSAKSTATATAAAAVRFPLRVCSKYSLPFSIVNSMSCISA